MLETKRLGLRRPSEAPFLARFTENTEKQMLLEFSSAGSSRRFAALTLLVAVMFELYPARGWAVDYPTRSITLVVPSPPAAARTPRHEFLRQN